MPKLFCIDDLRLSILSDILVAILSPELEHPSATDRSSSISLFALSIASANNEVNGVITIEPAPVSLIDGNIIW